MHDSLAKSLHGVALAAAALPRWVERDSRTAVDQATVIRDAAEQASREARELLVSLRARRDVPLVTRLTEMVREFEARSGIGTALEVETAPELDPDAVHELAQIVGEALENVHRHAGASHVVVRVRAGLRPATVEVTVTDDGAGFDPAEVPEDHFGLVGMRERADGLGGHLDVAAAPGEGTAVTLQVPEQRTRQEALS
jgi:signal transduction histidine kinase